MSLKSDQAKAAKAADSAVAEVSADYKNMLQLIQLRWTAVFGQVATILLVAYGYGIVLPVRSMLTVLAGLVVFNLLSMLRWRRPHDVANVELFFVLLVDVAALTAQLHFSGGTSNPFVFLYLLQVILAAVLLKSRFTWGIVAITCACFLGLAAWSQPLEIPADRNYGMASLYVQGMLICFFLNATLLVTLITRINRNLRTREARLAAMRERASEEEHVVRMGLLASGAAHELGTPLSIMSVIVGDWRHMPLLTRSKELQADIAELDGQIRRCKSIVSGILLSAGEARGESSEQTTVKAFLDALAEEWRSTRQIGEFIYDNQFHPDLPVVSDSTLKQTINNLLDNALEASPAWVCLKAAREDDSLVVTVTDRGPGFPPAILANIGKPYQSTKGRPGAGLGLFLVVNVTRTLGGRVEVDNRREGGAVVKLTLPLSAIELGEQR